MSGPVLILLAGILLYSGVQTEKSIQDQLRDVNQERKSAPSPVNFIADHGYPGEEHSVTTNDNYRLTVFRIPHGKNGNPDSASRPPVLLMHGLLGSAMDFLVTGPEQAFGFILADAGYDVWLGNVRGSSYSRAHTSPDMDPEHSKFWDFSWDDMAESDLPTLIDFVLSQNGNHQNLHYVGHSQGATAFFAMASTNPAMQTKVATMHALAPLAYMANSRSPFMRIIMANQRLFQEFVGRSGEFQTTPEMLQQAQYEQCLAKSAHKDLCLNLLYLMGGFTEGSLDSNQISTILKYSPSSASRHTVAHFAQMILTGTFQKFDHGLMNNVNKYNHPNPPTYDLSRVTVPVSIHYGDQDWLADTADVQRLVKELGNVRHNDQIFGYEHMHFVWAKDAKDLVYRVIINRMERKGA